MFEQILHVLIFSQKGMSYQDLEKLFVKINVYRLAQNIKTRDRVDSVFHERDDHFLIRCIIDQRYFFKTVVIKFISLS